MRQFTVQCGCGNCHICTIVVTCHNELTALNRAKSQVGNATTFKITQL